MEGPRRREHCLGTRISPRRHAGLPPSQTERAHRASQCHTSSRPSPSPWPRVGGTADRGTLGLLPPAGRPAPDRGCIEPIEILISRCPVSDALRTRRPVAGRSKVWRLTNVGGCGWQGACSALPRHVASTPRRKRDVVHGDAAVYAATVLVAAEQGHCAAPDRGCIEPIEILISRCPVSDALRTRRPEAGRSKVWRLTNVGGCGWQGACSALPRHVAST